MDLEILCLLKFLVIFFFFISVSLEYIDGSSGYFACWQILVCSDHEFKVKDFEILC